MTISTEVVILLLFVIASAVAIAARRFRVPYTVALVLVGFALGALQLLEAPELTPEILFLLFLPGLVFEAAYHLDFEDLWRDRLAILGLALPGVVASIGITSALLVFASSEVPHLFEIGWTLALVFAAAVAATDPISVVSLFKNLGAPRRLTLLIEGESLLNDGTSIVIFTLVLSLVGGEVQPPAGMLVEFIRVVGGGLAIGSLVGMVVAQAVKRIDDAMVEITLTTIGAYGSFLVAYQLGFSGVMSTVAAGLICGNYAARVGMSPSTRIATESFWEYVGFALNSLVFLLMGLQIRIETLWAIWPVIVTAYLAVTLSRGLIVVGSSALLGLMRAQMPFSWSIVLTWGGLRGALSMVLALSLPVDLPFRDLIVNMVFGVVLLSVLLQGLTMTPIARWLGVIGTREMLTAYEVARARRQLARDVLAEIDRLRNSGHADPKAIDVIEAEYRKRAEAADRALEGFELDERSRLEEDVAKLRRRMLLLEKERALIARQRGTIGADASNQLLADLDARFLEFESAGPRAGDKNT